MAQRGRKHGPPAASAWVTRSRWHAGLVVFLSALGLGLTIALARLQLVGVPLGALWLLCSAYAVWAWWHMPSGLLQWDGNQWFWQAAGTASRTCTVVVVADAQRCMLVRLQGSDPTPCWLWLQRPASTLQWTALRRALAQAGEEFTAASRKSDLEGHPVDTS